MRYYAYDLFRELMSVICVRFLNTSLFNEISIDMSIIEIAFLIVCGYLKDIKQSISEHKHYADIITFFYNYISIGYVIL
jgi:hypothetical protein